MSGIPMQHTCDMSDPAQHVLWALVNVGGRIGAPLLMPRKVMEEWSRHLFDAGFRHHPELQTIWYRPPGDDSTIWNGIGGEWISSEPGERPDDVDPGVVDALVGAMDDRLRAAVRARLDALEEEA